MGGLRVRWAQVRSRVREQMVSAMPKGHWIYLRTLLGPLVVLDLGCQTMRDISHGTVTGPVSYLDHVRSDVFFYSALLIMWIGLFVFVRAIWARVLLTIAFHATFAVLFFFAVASHVYYLSTGSLLKLDTVITTIKHFNEIRVVIESEVGPLLWIIMGAVVLLSVLGPIINVRHERVRWMWDLPEPYKSRPRAPGKLVVAGSAVLALVALSALPNFSGTTAFTRSRLVSIGMETFEDPEDVIPAGFVPPTRADVPDQTRLVPTAATKKRNVVVIFLESTSASATSLYNDDMQTTPFLKDLGVHSLVAKDAYTVVPHTSKSLVPGLCGVEPPFDSDNSESSTKGLASKCLPTLLAEQGYTTAFFQSATEDFERRRLLVKNLDFDEFHPLESFPKSGFSKTNYFGYEDDIMLKPSTDWAAAHRDQPFFMTYLTVTTHHDYTLPKGFASKRLSDDDTKNRYLNAVRYQDRFLQKLFDRFKELGLYDNTVFLLLGDHGEAFGEHRLKQHDDTAYQEGVHIPLVVHDPQRFLGGQTVDTPINNMTIIPTLAELLGYTIQGGTYHSASLLAEPVDQPLRIRCYHGSMCLAQIHEGKKYIHHFDLRPDEYFDIAKDPGEKYNIIDQQDPAAMARIRQGLLIWEAEVKAVYGLVRQPSSSAANQSD